MKTRRSAVWLFLSLWPAALGAASPQIDPAKEADIRHLLQATGATKNAAAMMKRMADQVKPLLENALPPGERRHQIAETFMDRLVTRATPDGLIQRLIPVYDKHLSHEEIKGLIGFYESPLGRRYVEVLPDLLQDSYAVSNQWGQEIGQQVIEEMAEEFPELKQKK